MPQRQHVRPFSSLLSDVATLHVVSRFERNRAPSPEEIAEQARHDGFHHGQIEGYMAGMSEGREAGIKQGRAEAYDQAYREAKAKWDEELGELFGILAGHVGAVNAEIPKWFEDAENAMTDRTLAIVERLLACELHLGRDHALAIVKESLAEVTHSTHVRVRMNPFDSVVVSQHRDELMALATQLRDIEFVDDPSILGGCILESDGGSIDARLETRLEIVKGELAA